MLSPSVSLRVNSATHLLFLVEGKQKQILRLAQDDIAQRFFDKLLIVMGRLLDSPRGLRHV
ncbi:MAG TPA: hypothetical protein VGY31_13055 [Terriglobia bacterium]|nr:hypothetical protein [Terriglobia bacterium]